jgi:hypothetical protein
VALETPLHLERGVLQHQRHLIDPPVARGASDALGDVHLMVEIHEIGQVVHPGPLEGRVVTETGPHRLQDRRLIPHLRMAVHAGFRGRNVGKRRFLDGGVAVPAIDAHAANVMSVAELDWLVDVDVLVGVVGRPVEQCEGRPEAADDEYECENAEPGIDVGIAMEELTHRVDVRAFSPKRLSPTRPRAVA